MSVRPVFVSHPSSLEHDTGGHPENIRRMLAIEAELERRGYYGWERLQSRAVTRDLLERVHPAAYVETIHRFAREGGGQLDPDTAMSPGSYTAALHAAGGAVDLVQRLLARSSAAGEPNHGASAGEPIAGSGVRPALPELGFSAHRPPGHHALASRAMGFCLFNNIAIAARYALDTLGLERVLILDWDVHHGNGTQELFWEDPRVLFCSIHQSPFWPGSGREAEVGRGAGHGYTVNLPVPAGSGDGVFVSLVRDVTVPLAREYRPQLILVSAGYDAHLDDPLAGCTVSDGGYGAMTALVRDLAAELVVPLGFVLEGGYDVDALARCVAITMSVAGNAAGDVNTGAPDAEPGAAAPRLAGTDPAVIAAILESGVHPLAAAARARLSAFWPTLA